MTVGLTVGRHAAGDDDRVHPIVAAALQRQAPGALGAVRHGRGARGAADGSEGGLGWPGPPADGTGLGWPADAPTNAVPVADEPGPLTVVAAQPTRRRPGWRRFFGGSPAPAADDTAKQDSSAA